MTDRELMQQVLEALQADEHDMVPDKEGHMIFRKDAAITALREALAEQPAQQQEPVATLDDIQQEIYENTREFVSLNVMEWMLKRYYTPPASKPLTDEQIGLLRHQHGITSDGRGIKEWTQVVAFARAIEAAHGIKGGA